MLNVSKTFDMNKLQVVVFNSPPRLGKDSAADHMIKLVNTEDTFYTAHQRAFKDSLFKLCAAMYGVTVEEFLERYDSKNIYSPTGWNKDAARFHIDNDINADCNCFHGCQCGYAETKYYYSQRSSLIHMSENIIKPVFGNDAFGKAMVASLPESGIVFISDGGFAEELIPVIKHVGDNNVLVVRIHKEGVTFEGDSRDYLKVEDLGEHTPTILDIDNEGTLAEFLNDVEKSVETWLNT